MTETRRAAFLDRDGTLIRDAHYIKDPRQVELLPGVPDGLRRLRGAGFELIVITNQSGISRGFLSESDYQAVRRELAVQLEAEGIELTATYHCPHHPEVDGACECRKPGSLLYRRAADEHALDLSRSVAIGDRWRDIAPAIALGSRGILVPIKKTPDADVAEALVGGVIAKDFSEAVSLVLGDARD